MLDELWTLVEHSRYVHGGDATFRDAVEPRSFRELELADRDSGTRGVILIRSAEAERLARSENFPADSGCMLAQVRGGFAGLHVSGQRLYLPPPKTLEAQCRWTLVRHAGWVRRRDPRFERAVQAHRVQDPRHMLMIGALGGFLSSSPDEAWRAEERENYPCRGIGERPCVRGSFTEYSLAGLPLYRPAQPGRDRLDVELGEEAQPAHRL